MTPVESVARQAESPDSSARLLSMAQLVDCVAAPAEFRFDDGVQQDFCGLAFPPTIAVAAN